MKKKIYTIKYKLEDKTFTTTKVLQNFWDVYDKLPTNSIVIDIITDGRVDSEQLEEYKKNIGQKKTMFPFPSMWWTSNV